MTSFDAGCRQAMVKVAVAGDVEELVTSAIQQHLPARQSVSGGDELETLFSDDGKLETIISGLEDELGVELDADTAFALFADGTVNDLVKALASAVLEKRASGGHAYYMRNRQQIQMRNRQYRARNLMQIRRKARAYRRRVKRRMHRPRQRVGSAAGGYSFVQR